ncbi:Galactose-3-O-sulfotransferase, partial [Halocaridina rubra]
LLGRLGRNQMTFDLGLDDGDLKQESVLKEAFRILESNFHLVMLAERMDESLVLLRHLMCWTDDDVMVLARNVRKDRYRSYMGEHTVNTLEHFNAIDVKLYAYFKERFERQIDAFGVSRMEEEVTKLREYRDKKALDTIPYRNLMKKVWKRCGIREVPNKRRTISLKRKSHEDKSQEDTKDLYVIQYQYHTNGTYRQRRFCKDLIRTGTEFTQVLRWKQYARYHYNINNHWNLSWTPLRKKQKKKPRKPNKHGPVPGATGDVAVAGDSAANGVVAALERTGKQIGALHRAAKRVRIVDVKKGKHKADPETTGSFNGIGAALEGTANKAETLHGIVKKMRIVEINKGR